MVSFTFRRNFPDLKIHEPFTEKPHVIDISCKAYMVKTVICHTLAMSTVIIDLYSCMVTTCMCICIGVSRNSRFSAVYAYKKSSLIWLDPFLVQGVYRFQYKQLAKVLSMVIILHSYLYNIMLNYLAGPAHSYM